MKRRTMKPLSCPFCGEMPIAFAERNRSLLHAQHYVECCCASCPTSPSTRKVWNKTREAAIVTWNRRASAIPGSTARLVSVLVDRVLGGEDQKRACADYTWEHEVPPDLASLAALVALREATRQFVKWVEAAEQGCGKYAIKRSGRSMVFTIMEKALRRADRAAGRRTR